MSKQLNHNGGRHKRYRDRDRDMGAGMTIPMLSPFASPFVKPLPSVTGFPDFSDPSTGVPPMAIRFDQQPHMSMGMLSPLPPVPPANLVQLPTNPVGLINTPNGTGIMAGPPNLVDSLTGRVIPINLTNPFGQTSKTINTSAGQVTITASSEEELVKTEALLKNAENASKGVLSGLSGLAQFTEDSNFMPIDSATSGTLTPTNPANPSLLSTGASGWSRIQHPSKIGKTLLVSPTGVKYSGSGVLIIETIGTNTYVVLVQNAVRRTFEDMGGDINNVIVSDLALSENARNEVAEETQNLYLIQNNTLLNTQVSGVDRFIDVPDGEGHTYRIYILYLKYNGNGLEIKGGYAKNKQALLYAHGALLPVEWRETTDIDRFNLSTINAELSKSPTLSSIAVPSASGVPCQLRDRTVSCLRSLLLQTDKLKKIVDATPRPSITIENGKYSGYDFVRINIV
jgi:hypothetical protein